MARWDSTQLSKLDKFWRWTLLGLGVSSAIGLFSAHLGIRGPAVPCLVHTLIGVPCPGCGTTRSLLALIKGNWLEAVQYHLFAPLLAGISLYGLIRVSLELGTGRSLPPMPLLAWMRWSDRGFRSWWFWLGGFFLWLGYYALRVYSRYYEATLPIEVIHHPLWQLLTAKSLEL